MPKKIPTLTSKTELKSEIPKAHKRTSDFAAYYVNSVNFAFTPFDIQMVCGRIEATMEEGNEETDEIVTIIMNPMHAKLILKAFSASLQAYEDKNGEIAIPMGNQPESPTKEQKVLASAARRKKK
jgi:hypothetical protein